MQKRFNIATGLLIDARIEPLFKHITVIDKEVGRELITYIGDSGLFNNIKSDVAKIGYHDGNFKAFEDKQDLPEYWIPLNEKGSSFDNDKVIPEDATANYEMIKEDKLSLSDIKDLSLFLDNLHSSRVNSLAVKYGYPKDATIAKKVCKEYLMALMSAKIEPDEHPEGLCHVFRAIEDCTISLKKGSANIAKGTDILITPTEDPTGEKYKLLLALDTLELVESISMEEAKDMLLEED